MHCVAVVYLYTDVVASVPRRCCEDGFFRGGVPTPYSCTPACHQTVCTAIYIVNNSTTLVLKMTGAIIKTPFSVPLWAMSMIDVDPIVGFQVV